MNTPHSIGSIADGMEKSNCLELDVGVEHPLAVNDLQLEGAFKV